MTITENVFEEETKPLKIIRVNPASENDVVELGCTNRSRQLDKEFAANFNETDGDKRINDIGRIEEVWNFTTLLSTEFVKASEFMDDSIFIQETGQTLSVDDKEDVERVLEDYMRSQSDVRPVPYRIEYGNITVDGFIGGISIDESSVGSNSVYNISLDFLVALAL